MNDNVIGMKNVSKMFAEKAVLKNLHFDVPQGSVVGLLGKNGAGKTTLLKCILGLLRPQTGTIRVYQEDAWDLSETAKEKIGYVPQNSTFYTWFTVSEMINYTAAFYPKWNRGLVEKLVEDWGLESGDLASKLSVGQAQTLSIILALGHEPELLVLDEPVASLDPVARRHFLRNILDVLANRSCTIVFSSHITSDLERVADRVAILQGGRIELNTELDQLKDRVKRLKIRFPQPVPADLALPGTLRKKVAGNEAIITTQDFDASWSQDLGRRWQADVQVEDLNLEDIFVEMTQ